MQKTITIDYEEYLKLLKKAKLQDMEFKIKVLNSFVREEGNQEEKDCWEVIKNIVRRSYDLY